MILSILILLICAYLVYRSYREDKQPVKAVDDIIESRLKQLEDSLACVKSQNNSTNAAMQEIPNKILGVFKSSMNNLKGDLGEFIQLLRLKADYDIVIPLGDVVDFLCIRFPSEEHAGTVDFIEVKTNSSRLSISQKIVRELLKGGKVGFKSVRVTVNDLRT